VQFIVIPVHRVDDVHPVVKKGRNVPPYPTDPVALKGTVLHRLGSNLDYQMESRRLDDRSSVDFADIEVTVRFLGSSGTPKEFTKSYQKDLRRMNDVSEDDRKNIVKLAETGALLRCMRAIFGVGSYQRDQVKPLVMARLVYTGRDENPERQAMLDKLTAIREVGGLAAMFGKSGGQSIAGVMGAMFGGGGQAPAQLPAGPEPVHHPALQARNAATTSGPLSGELEPEDEDDRAPTSNIPESRPVSSAPPPAAPPPAARVVPPAAPTPPSATSPRRVYTVAPVDDSYAAKNNKPPRWTRGQRFTDMDDRGLSGLRSYMEWTVNNRSEKADWARDHIAAIDGVMAARVAADASRPQ
jgi:hypothetical protein